MAGTTFSHFTPVALLPPSGNGLNGTPNTAGLVLTSNGNGGVSWAALSVAGGGTGGTTPQTSLDALASPTGTNLNLGGNIVLSPGGKITGDMSNASALSRVYFQTSVANGATVITAIPNGTVATSSPASVLDLHDSTSASGNGSVFRLANIQGAELRIQSLGVGVGTVRPITFYLGNQQVGYFSTVGTQTTLNLTGGVQSALTISPATANSATTLGVVDNSGSPYTYLHTINPSSPVYHDFHTHYFRNVTGTNLLMLGNVGQIGVNNSWGNAGQLLQSGGSSAAATWITPDTTAAASTIAKRTTDGSLYATYLYGRATSANYADLAEIYSTDTKYPVGTVIVVSESELFDCAQSTSPDQHVLGAISEFPAYLMNDVAEGQPIALVGRVPVRVFGPVRKGQRIGPSDVPGAGIVSTRNAFATALETNMGAGEKLVECVIK